MSEQIPEKMQAVVCHGPHDYRLEEVAVPELRPGEALIRVEAVGICASDLKCYHGAAKFWGDENRPAWAETMVIPGHEFAGRVVELDDAAAERWGIAVGDRVVSEQIVPCWECRFCKRGQYHMCQPHDLYGFKRRTPGAMASYMVYPAEALVHKVSGDIARAPRGVRGAVVVLTARRRARADHLRGHRRGGRLRADRPRDGRRRPRQEPDARDRPGHGGGQAQAGRGLRRRHHDQHRRAGCRQRDQGPHRRLRRRRLSGGHWPSFRCSPGPQPVTQAGPLRGIRRLRQ